MKRIKYTLILVLLVAAGLALLAATQTWFTLQVPSASQSGLAVSGAVAAPALSALGFAGLALAAALAIAGPVIRVVLGILGVVLGGSVVLAAAIAIGDPVRSGGSVVTRATGVAGDESLHGLVTAVGATAWPAVGVAAGVLLALGSIAVLISARLWPASSRRYQAARFESANPGVTPGATPAASPADEAPRSVDEWDELSRGDDPTA